MAVAEDIVQVPVGNLEEPYGLAVAVVFEAGLTKDGVFKGDRDW